MEEGGLKMLSKRMPQRLDEDRSKSCKSKKMSEAQEGSVNMRMHTLEYKTIVMHKDCRRRNEDQMIDRAEKKRTKYCMLAKEKEKKNNASKY
jgi:hypothetical protein